MPSASMAWNTFVSLPPPGSRTHGVPPPGLTTHPHHHPGSAHSASVQHQREREERDARERDAQVRADREHREREHREREHQAATERLHRQQAEVRDHVAAQRAAYYATTAPSSAQQVNLIFFTTLKYPF